MKYSIIVVKADIKTDVITEGKRAQKSDWVNMGIVHFECRPPLPHPQMLNL